MDVISRHLDYEQMNRDQWDFAIDLYRRQDRLERTKQNEAIRPGVGLMFVNFFWTFLPILLQYATSCYRQSGIYIYLLTFVITYILSLTLIGRRLVLNRMNF